MINNEIMKKDNSYDDELERLINSNSNVLSQYVIFRSGLEELYALNVMKVEELLIYSDLTVSKNATQTANLGVAKVRENMVNIIHFDRWIGKGEIDESSYELIMLCSYGGKRVGILIKDVVGIMDLDNEKLFPKDDDSGKMSHITEIDHQGERKLCLLVDSDRLLLDTHKELENSLGTNLNLSVEKIDSQKLVLVAEDSKLIQLSLKALFEKLGVNGEFFDNGKELIESIGSYNIDDIGLIITDIEMPMGDGFYVLENIKKDEKYSAIPVIVNSNMANSTLFQKAQSLQADSIIEKPDISVLSREIKTYIRE